jgi:hypothetical protein
MYRLIPLALMAFVSTAALPPPGTCGDWVPQPGGISWRMCSDVQNLQYCEMKERGTITRITCP